ncbi:MAG: MYG1 family protein [Clostridiales bacterium]|nr:MYG1 family protein [Clostridiales bacterium]
MSIRTTTNPYDANFITHSGSFHADDVLATVILSKTFLGTATVMRTSAVPKEGFVEVKPLIYDLGGGKFDHHQKGGNGTRENGVPYASAGLIWKEYGLKILFNTFNDASDYDIKFIFDYIDGNLIQGVDAYDNGVMPKVDYPVQNMCFSEIIENFNPTWEENNQNADFAFIQAVSFAESVFDRLVENAHAKTKVREKIISAISESNNGIMVLDQDIDWQEELFRSTDEKASNILYVIYPSNRGDYKVRCVPDVLEGFGQRKTLPSEWHGLKGEELQKVTKVSDAVFCHPNGFVAGADSLEGALALANLAIKA